MPERYRDLVRPSLVETGVVQSNAGSAAQALAETFKTFERVGSGFLADYSATKGQREGAAAGDSGNPNFRKGARALNIYGKAYNNAALRSYAVKSEVDAEETAARLEEEAANDPEKFRATFGKVRDETLKVAPPEARATLAEIYNRRLGAGTTRLVRAQAQEVRAEQRSSTAEGILRATDKIGQLKASDDPVDAFEAEEEELKLGMLINGAEADGTLSSTEALALRRESTLAVAKNTVVARFVREFDDPYGSPIDFIEQLREANKASEVLPPDEEAKVVDMLFAELRDRNALRSARKTATTAEVQARYDAGDKLATSLLLSDKLSQRKLLSMVDSGDLEPTTARTLMNELETGATRLPKSNQEELFHVETNLLSLEEEDIRSNSELTWADRARLVEKRREEATGWKSTQQAREGSDRIDRALGLAPGMSTKAMTVEEARQRDTALTEWYNLVEALPPAARQGQAIELAEQVTEKVIRSNARSEVAGIRARIDRLIRESGDPEEMGTAKRKQFDLELKRQQDRLREAEAKAK